MSVRGVPQLQKITLFYSKNGGSSRGTREFIDTILPEVKAKHSHVEIEVLTRGSRHPYVIGEYVNGKHYQFGLKNADAQDILKTIERLRNRTGRGIPSQKWPGPLDGKRSLQGKWNIMLNRISEDEQVEPLFYAKSQIRGVIPPIRPDGSTAINALEDEYPKAKPDYAGSIEAAKNLDPELFEKERTKLKDRKNLLRDVYSTWIE